MLKQPLRADALRTVRISAVAVQVLPSLSTAEAEEKAECEAVIDCHVRSYFDSAKAMKRIHDGKLYRDEFGTFEAYCLEKWGMSRNYAYRQVKAAEIIEQVLLPIGNTPLPENESQVRPLTALPLEKIRVAWKQVTKRARGSKITASLVNEVVQELLPCVREMKTVASSGPNDIQNLLFRAAEAVGKDLFDEALHDIEQAKIRIDVEVAKAKRSTEP